ncbi:Cir_N domain-containing protein, partial [Haematococcus lacustris]
MKKWEAEQQALKEAKAKEQGMAEFEAEQEAMKTMSYLSEAQQQQYKDRASIAFMYAKPPGLDAALAKEQAAAAAKD